MGRVGNISSAIPGETRQRGVRAARLSKEDTKHKPARHRPRAVAPARSAKRVAIEEEPLVIERFDSVWDALEFSPEEKANLEVRSYLMIQLEILIERNKWTQAAAAKMCGVSQPRINDLLRGRIDKFSIDALVNMAGALGQKVKIEMLAA
jgi:predicted XRE-type DNA-binding protein